MGIIDMSLSGPLKAVVLALLLSATSAATAQTARPIQVDVDHASFAYSPTESMVEIYLAFEASNLSYSVSGDGYVAELPLNLAVFRSSQASLTGTPTDAIWADSLDLSFLIADTSGIQQGQHFIHQVRLTTPPGEYELQVDVAADVAAGRPAFQVHRDLLVPTYSGEEGVDVSDITLAVSIEQSTAREDPFFKNGIMIRPNANQIFGSGLDRVFYYAEVYGADRVPSSSGNYEVLSYIAEANVPQPLDTFQKRTQRKVASPDVLVGAFDITGLPSGSYYLRVVILGESNEALAEQSRKFFVYNPLVAREQPTAMAETSFETSRYAAMPEDELELAEKHIQIIATESERRRQRGIRDLDERRRFLMDFWNTRDPKPQTPINEFQEDFYSRLQYANDRYTTSFEEGWNTDRGRTLIKYGSPSAIEPHQYDRGMIPYELWEYNNIPGEGKSQFIFADRDGFGSFELIHSTVTGERKLANWMEELTNG